MRSIVQSILKPFGLRLARLDNSNGPGFGAGVLFSTLKRFNFSPGCVMDVGANHGNWTREALKYFPEAEYLLIEPQDHLKAHIQDLIDVGRKIRWVNVGAADNCGTQRFFVRDRDDSSTFLPLEGQTKERVKSEILMEVLTLDAIVAKYQLRIPDLVKIDAEGLDLKILNGASSLIGKTDVFLLEAGVVCPFENSVGQVIARMDNLGYRLLDITELNRSPKHKVLWLVELAFLRKTSPLLESALSYD